MRSKLAIIHFNPIERYPPVLNWLNYLSAFADKTLQVRVYTTHPSSSFQYYEPAASFIEIIRIGNLKQQAAPLRYANYSFFYLGTIARLAGWRPDYTLYYETLSALPAIIYKKFFSRASGLLVHYHEYISAVEYETGIYLNRRLHQLEKKTYPVMSWISHTNADRMSLFTSENKMVTAGQSHILPNYPPLSWRRGQREKTVTAPIKFVYVGALSLETMYVREFANWVIAQQGTVTWTIYSSNMPAHTRDYLVAINSPYICFNGSIDYFSLPAVFQKEDVGIILYKGHIPNYVYNAPNKLFEYYACGLDVWFPKLMLSCLPFATQHSYPKIIPVDFENLSLLDLSSLTSHAGLAGELSGYYCEEVLGELLEKGLDRKPLRRENRKPATT